MSKKIIDILNGALTQIFKEIGCADYAITAQSPIDAECEVILTIGITGAITGTMMLKSNLKSAAAIAQFLLNKIDYYPAGNEFTEVQQEAIREIMNLISARALMLLSEQNIDCNLTPPTLILGKHVNPHIYQISHTIYSGIKGSFGELTLIFGIKNERIP